MRIKLALSAILLVAYLTAVSVWKYFYSPATARATAAQMNDTTSAYLSARFIREGGVQSTIFWIFILAVAAVWLWPSRKNKNINPE